jgi:hypothetical protein
MRFVILVLALGAIVFAPTACKKGSDWVYPSATTKTCPSGRKCGSDTPRVTGPKNSNPAHAQKGTPCGKRTVAL